MADEELLSPKTIGKYLAKSKAPKTQVTPVRKQDADFRITPSLTGPATVKRKLGDNEGYPRGYNPQQMNEVRQAEAGDRLRLFSDSTMQDGRKHANHETALARENIARSNFNPTTLPRPLNINIEPYPDAPAEHISKGHRGEININPGLQEDNVLIHEIGHEAMHHDADANRQMKDLLKPSLDQIKHIVGRAGGTLDFDNEGLLRGYNFHGGWFTNHAALASHTEEYSDLQNGYSEGYADKFQDNNYVRDPRLSGEPEVSSYRLEGFVGPFVSPQSRLKAFSTGYHAAGPKPIDINSEDMRKGYEMFKSHPFPELSELSTRSPEHTFTGQNLIDAVDAARAARNSTDDELRNTNG